MDENEIHDVDAETFGVNALDEDPDAAEVDEFGDDEEPEDF